MQDAKKRMKKEDSALISCTLAYLRKKLEDPKSNVSRSILSQAHKGNNQISFFCGPKHWHWIIVPFGGIPVPCRHVEYSAEQENLLRKQLETSYPGSPTSTYKISLFDNRIVVAW